MKYNIIKIYKRIYHREFRPSWIFHIPTFCIYFYFSIKARNPVFFSATNPGMYMWWFMGNSKEEIHNFVSKKYCINEHNFIPWTTIFDIQDYIINNNLSYPMIIKPTIGGRQGYKVYYIQTEWNLQSYISLMSDEYFLLQEYIEWEEYSVYYCRYPDHKTGTILGITKKEYPTIIGDGKTTIGSIIKQHDRYNRYYNLFAHDYHIDMGKILQNWEKYIISRIGNHCKWSLFLDRSAHTTEKIIQETDKLVHHDSNVYLYRSDIKAQSRNDVVNGNYKIIEINWVFSEPTFIYDPGYKILDAYKQIYKVRYHTYKIAIINHNKKNVPYFPIWQGIRLIIQYLSLNK